MRFGSAAVMVMALAAVAITAWALVDIARRPRVPKGWLLAVLLGWGVGLGWLFAVLYLIFGRSRLDARLAP